MCVRVGLIPHSRVVVQVNRAAVSSDEQMFSAVKFKRNELEAQVMCRFEYGLWFTVSKVRQHVALVKLQLSAEI